MIGCKPCSGVQEYAPGGTGEWSAAGAYSDAAAFTKLRQLYIAETTRATAKILKARFMHSSVS